MKQATKSKRRSVSGEKIARLDVKSSFRDIREGIGGRRNLQLDMTDQDIAAALGMVSTALGKPTVWALETYYGSTTRHEHSLRRAWADESEHHSDPADERIRNRIAAALAIREFAGGKFDLREWSLLTDCKAAEFQRNVVRVLAWLEELRDTGLESLRNKLAEHRAAVDSRK